MLIVAPASGVNLDHLFAHAERIRPLMLVFVELLEIDECVSIARIEAQDLLESFERSIDEAAMPEVQSEAPFTAQTGDLRGPR